MDVIGPTTVTGIFRTLGNLANKHWTVYQKFFYRAAWSLEELSIALLVHVICPMIIESAVLDESTGKPVADMAIDDTTVAVFALYRKRSDCKSEDIFRTRQELAGEMIQTAAEALPEVRLRVSADGQYAKRQVVQALPEGVNLVSRIRRDAAIYQLPAKRRPKGKRGRKPKKGKRLPCPRKIAAYRKKGFKKITVYKQGYQVQRLVLGITCDDFFFCTDATVADEEIVQRYYDRWGVEECILEAKQHMGFESTQGWCSKTVNRQAPLAMVLLTLVKAWYARCAVDEPSLLPETMPWYEHKRHPSFVDMLSALRKVLWQHRIPPNLRFSQRVKELIETVSYGLFAA